MTEQEFAKLLHDNPDLRAIHYGDNGHAINVSAVRQSEHELQVELIKECDRRAATNPLWGLILAIPNGGHRSKAVAGKLKAEGVRAGVPDLLLPVERRGYIGLFIELKIGNNPLSPAQEVWAKRLTAQGYYHAVIRDDVQKAVDLIAWYLEGK